MGASLIDPPGYPDFDNRTDPDDFDGPEAVVCCRCGETLEPEEMDYESEPGEALCGVCIRDLHDPEEEELADQQLLMNIFMDEDDSSMPDIEF